MDRAEEVANNLLKGTITCEACPDLTRLVNNANSGIISKDKFIDTIRYHLSVNDRLKEVV